jgi:hypothetical protein
MFGKQQQVIYLLVYKSIPQKNNKLMCKFLQELFENFVITIKMTRPLREDHLQQQATGYLAHSVNWKRGKGTGGVLINIQTFMDILISHICKVKAKS